MANQKKRNFKSWEWLKWLSESGWLKRLRGNEVKVMNYIAQKANDLGECYPGFRSIQRFTGLSRTRIAAAIRGCESYGLLRVRRKLRVTQGGKTNVYKVQMPETEAVPI